MRAKYVSIEVASARGVADRWFQGRFRDSVWIRDLDAGIHERLLSLGDNPSIEAASEIIGNKSWTHVSCSGCSSYVDRGVRLGESYEGHVYCRTCIEEAHQILIGEPK
jgi:hypothetical protein